MQWIQLDATVAEVEELLLTDFFWFQHVPTGTENVAAEQYHIPSEVQKHIDYITPGIRLRPDPGQVRRLKRQADGEKLRKRAVKAMNTGFEVVEASDLPPLNSSVCDIYVTQECIRTQYGIPKGDKAAPGNELGIFESLGTCSPLHQQSTDWFYRRSLRKGGSRRLLGDSVPGDTPRHIPIREEHRRGLRRGQEHVKRRHRVGPGLRGRPAAHLASADGAVPDGRRDLPDRADHAEHHPQGLLEYLLRCPGRLVLHVQRLWRDGELCPARVPRSCLPEPRPGGLPGPASVRRVRAYECDQYFLRRCK